MNRGSARIWGLPPVGVTRAALVARAFPGRRQDCGVSKVKVNGVEMATLPPDLQSAQNRQMKMTVLTAVFVYVVSNVIMISYYMFFKYQSCDIDTQFPPVWLFPFSHKFIEQLDAGHVARSQSCFLVAVLSTAMIPWLAAILVQLFWSGAQKVFVSIPFLLFMVGGLATLCPMVLSFVGISRFKTLFGPSADRPMTINCFIILFMVGSEFMMLMWIVDQIVAYLRFNIGRLLK